MKEDDMNTATETDSRPIVGLETGELRSLAELEAVIERGIDTFKEVGQALMEVRDRRLYRATHGDFDTYCRERWGFTKTHANRLIRATKTVMGLAPIGATSLPVNEAQARELARIPNPETRAQVWEAAVAEHGPAVTAKNVRDVEVEITRTTRSFEVLCFVPDERIEMGRTAAQVDAALVVLRDLLNIPPETLVEAWVLGRPRRDLEKTLTEFSGQFAAYAEAVKDVKPSRLRAVT
jgi:hypothetical protein